MRPITSSYIPEYNKPGGKLGNYVYYFDRGVYRRRLYVKPIQPGTPTQKHRWSQFRNYVKKWQGLKQSEKNEWNRKAEDFRMSGFNYYISWRFSI